MSPGELPPLVELPEPLRTLSGRIEAVIYLATAEPGRRPLYVSPAAGFLFGFPAEVLVAEPELLLAHLHPDDRERLRAEVRKNVGATFTHLRYRLIDGDGRILWCRETMAAVEGGGAVAGVVLDVSELELPQKALEASLAASEPRGAVAALGDVLAQSFALSHTVFVDTRTGARRVSRHGPLGVAAGAEWDLAHQPEPWAEEAVARRAAALVSDGAEALLSAELRALCPGARLGMVVPLLGEEQGGPAGALIGVAPRPLRMHPMHLRMLDALGQQGGLALQRTELVAALRRTGSERQQLADFTVRAHEEERSRLARELHDGAGQTLTAVAIQLDLAERRSIPAARPAIAAARKQVEQTLEELRRLAHALRPAALDGLGLAQALAEMARSLDGGSLAVRLDLPESLPPIPPQVATALFRVAQAALTNVVRHARARHAQLRLAVEEPEPHGRRDPAAASGSAASIRLLVSDDGQGFAAAPGQGGLGLVAMRERTLALGGRFRLQSEPGRGTQVTAAFPLHG